ncbi:hypothetical protein FOA22_22435 [Heyndrickxia oleronia]
MRMREIKFRGYAVEKMVNSQWLVGFGVSELKFAEHYAKEVGRDSDWWIYTYSGDYRVDPKSIGQYTGLKDKNGKEIYEGDILQLRNIENKPYHMEVLWTGQGYGYKIIRNDTKSSGYIVGHLSERGLNFYNQTAEVIGNIYEKPSLLEV